MDNGSADMVRFMIQREKCGISVSGSGEQKLVHTLFHRTERGPIGPGATTDRSYKVHERRNAVHEEEKREIDVDENRDMK